MNPFKSRYALLVAFISIFLFLSFALRLTLTIWTWNKIDWHFSDMVVIFGKGFLFDSTVAFSFCTLYSIYLLCIPERFNRSLVNKLITYLGFFTALLICMFAFFAEITFWKEFDSRFNFIAVDYLIYTYEVIENISESYPLPYLVSGIVAATIIIMLLLVYTRSFTQSFHVPTPFRFRGLYTITTLLIAACGLVYLSNDWAERHNNRYFGELSKSGIFSFFAAFKNNDLNYEDFYLRSDTNSISAFTHQLRRDISHTGEAVEPNVIMITIESLSANYLKHFGSSLNLTPTLDSLADESILFTDMYATGTRTVRGIEALTMSIPPCPGNSIVRRQLNQHLFSIGSVFRDKGYSTTFFYGGDGYFDNMNAFFGNNGFEIVDRGRKLIPRESISAARTRIADSVVHFENAWGVSDEDLYEAVVRDADHRYAKHQKFYDFVMTTSNHRPYSYPSGKIDIPSGSGRDGAVKYTDYAIGKLLQKIRSKPWFDNTVLIFVADHCASVAGKEEINVGNYHIPCMIYNVKNKGHFRINTQCSQIDLYPTFFGLENWSYTSNFFGQDVLAEDYQPRAFIGTYQKLGYLRDNSLVVLSPKRQVHYYQWQKMTNTQQEVSKDSALLKKSICYYQSAADLFISGGLKERK